MQLDTQGRAHRCQPRKGMQSSFEQRRQHTLSLLLENSGAHTRHTALPSFSCPAYKQFFCES